jgi:molecular chaperone DnaK (HSP70)
MIIVFLVFLIYYIAYQKQILKCISDAIGMKNVNVINESSAITIYYGYTRYKDMFVIEKNKINKSIQKNVIFIDIGHSKTSFIYSTFNYSKFKVEKVFVLPNIGGRNFDYKLLNVCKKYFREKQKIPENDEKFEQIFQKQILRIQEAITKARKLLTVNKNAMITVEALYNDEDLKYLLTRDDFNNIIKEELKQIKK